MKTKLFCCLFAVVLLVGFAAPVSALAALPQTAVEITPRSVEVPGTPMNVSAFVSAYNAIRREGAPEIEATYMPGVINVLAYHDKPFSTTLSVDNTGLVKGYSVTVVSVNYDNPDPALIYADMMPSMLTGLEVLGVDPAVWATLQETEYTKLSPDDYKRWYVGETFTCEQYLGYAEWFPGDYRLVTMRLAVYL